MANYDWTGTASDGLIWNPDNWGPLGAPAGPPAQGDGASIINGAVEIDQATIEVGNLSINSGSLDDNGRRLVVGGLLSVVEDGEVDFGELDLDLNTSNLSGGRIEVQDGVSLSGRDLHPGHRPARFKQWYRHPGKILRGLERRSWWHAGDRSSAEPGADRSATRISRG
jgi:hypothetical protein